MIRLIQMFIVIPVCLFGAMSINNLACSYSNANYKQVNDTINVKYKDVEIGCLMGNGRCDKCIITNDKEYQALLKEPSPHPDCASYKLPYIDFSKYILIGRAIGVGGCKEPESSKELIKIPSEKKYVLKTNVKQNGMCEIAFTVRIWIMIPKIEHDYKIDFSNNTTLPKNY